jgi:CcmD family protein
MTWRTVFVLVSLSGTLLLPELAHAQGGLADPETIAAQNLRGYTHMFIAYAITWALVFGWAVSISRRLGRIEKALKN